MSIDNNNYPKKIKLYVANYSKDGENLKPYIEEVEINVVSIQKTGKDLDWLCYGENGSNFLRISNNPEIEGFHFYTFSDAVKSIILKGKNLRECYEKKANDCENIIEEYENILKRIESKK